MDIQITTKKNEGVERLLEVSVPVETVTAAEQREAQRYASSARIPGFRPGKAPAQLVRKRFKDAIRQQVLESLVQDAYKEVLEREQLKVAAQPHIHHVHFDEGKPLTFELHVEVRPELELARVEGFALTRPATTVTDDVVREQLDQLREQRATWAPVEEKPREGDMVTVLLATADESGVIPEGAEYRLTLGGAQAIPGIEELVMELAPGSTAERPVRWPEDFPDETQRGQTKTVRVTLQEVKRKSLPPLDDALARELGDFDSVDALTTAVREDVERNVVREADASVRQQLIDQIIAANPFEVPPSWVQSVTQAYLEMYKIPKEEAEPFLEQFRPMAERQVRRDLIIDTLSERHELKATEADIDDKVSEVATQRGADAGQVYAQLQKAGRLKELEQSITEEKVFAWLLERSTVQQQ